MKPFTHITFINRRNSSPFLAMECGGSTPLCGRRLGAAAFRAGRVRFGKAPRRRTSRQESEQKEQREVRGNPRRIVVGRTGDQAGAELFEEAGNLAVFQCRFTIRSAGSKDRTAAICQSIPGEGGRPKAIFGPMYAFDEKNFGFVACPESGMMLFFCYGRFIAAWPARWKNHASETSWQSTQHRDHCAHRRGEDDGDGAFPFLCRPDTQDRRSPRRRYRHGLPRGRA